MKTKVNGALACTDHSKFQVYMFVVEFTKKFHVD